VDFYEVDLSLVVNFQQSDHDVCYDNYRVSAHGPPVRMVPHFRALFRSFIREGLRCCPTVIEAVNFANRPSCGLQSSSPGARARSASQPSRRTGMKARSACPRAWSGSSPSIPSAARSRR
jgi:hypothetical protein